MEKIDIDKLPLMDRVLLDKANEIAGLLAEHSFDDRVQILHWLVLSLKEEMDKDKNEHNKPQN